MKVSICDFVLKANTYKERKADKNRGWRIEEIDSKEFIHYANRFSLSTALFTSRKASALKALPKLIMIDVDEAENNVEERLEMAGLYYIKVPSGSNDGWDIDYKWHFFVPLAGTLAKGVADRDKAIAIAKGQIQAFYDELHLDGFDPSAIDVARYFAPGGAMEIQGTPQWEARVKWCDQESTAIKGNRYVPKDIDDVMPIYGGSGKQVYIKPLKTDFAASEAWEPELKCKRIEGGKGLLWRLEQDTPISLGGDNWSTAGDLANQIKEGETVSNTIGCPGFNHEHSMHPSTIGYGYIQRGTGDKKDVVWFNCGGSHCQGDVYYLSSPIMEVLNGKA